MPIKYNTQNKELFTSKDEIEVRNYFMNAKQMTEKTFKNYLLSKFDEFIHDDRCLEPIEKYQLFEDYVMSTYGQKLDSYGLKGINTNEYTMFDNTKYKPTMNKFFKEHLGNLSSKDYKKVLNGFNHEPVEQKNTRAEAEDYRDHQAKFEHLVNARKELNPIVKFFYWLFRITASEEKCVNDIAEANGFDLTNPVVHEVKEVKEVAKKPTLLSIDDNELDMEVEEELVEYKPLTKEKFIIRNIMSNYEKVMNATVLNSAMKEYKRRESGRSEYSVEQVKRSYKELKDMAETLGLDETLLNDAMKDENPVSYIRDFSKTDYTDEEVEKYNPPKEKVVEAEEELTI